MIAVGSGDEAIERLSTCPTRPDLICDYRLRGEENGIEVIERLRSEYNEALPAMLITGDTAPSRLAEAQASGLLLLHKPVSKAARGHRQLDRVGRRSGRGDAEAASVK